MAKEIFAGIRLTESLESAMQNCSEVEKSFFSDPVYLTIFNTGGDSYLGKKIVSGTSVDSLDDLSRNILSLVRRISPDRSYKKSEIIVVTGDSEP